MSAAWPQRRVGDLVVRRRERVVLEDGVGYRTMGVRWYGKGAYERGIESTATVKAKSLFRAGSGDFIFNRIDTQKGAFDVVPRELDGALVTNEFPLYQGGPELDVRFLLLHFQQPHVLASIDAIRGGSEGRARWKEADFEASTLALPPLAEQLKIVDLIATVDAHIQRLRDEVSATIALRDAVLTRSLEPPVNKSTELGATASATESAGWIVRPFPEVVDFREGPGIMARDFRNAGVPLIRLAGVKPGANILDGCNYLDASAVERRWSHFKLAEGDVLLSTSASLGEVASVPATGVGAIPYTGLIRMRANPAITSQAFLAWILRGPDFARQVRDMGVGVTMNHFGPSHLKKMTLCIPPMENQHQALGVLEGIAKQILDLEQEAESLDVMRGALTGRLLRQRTSISASYGSDRGGNS